MMESDYSVSSMKKATNENPIVELFFDDNPQVENKLFDSMKKYLDLLNNPKYLDAMDKLHEICSKQNPNLN